MMQEEELTERLLNQSKGSEFDATYQEETIPYKYISATSGDQHEVRVKVTVHGDPSASITFLTMHDIGLSPKTQFSTLFNCELLEPLKSKFCVVHVGIPGLDKDDSQIQAGCYPSLDQMAEMIPFIVNHFNLKRVYLFGVGVGANVLLRFSLNDQSRVDGCIFANPMFTQQSWSSFFHQKIFGTSHGYDYLDWYHFNGDYVSEQLKDSKNAHLHDFKKLNENNIKELINSLERRTEINLMRTPLGKSNLRVPTLLLVGDASPHNEDTAELNSRLNPQITTLVKMQDAGSMILEQQPMKTAEAIILFLQGQGHFPALSILQMSQKRARAVKSQAEIFDVNPNPAQQQLSV